MADINHQQDASRARSRHHAAMDATTAELLRCLQNLIRLGVVAEIDHANPPRVRVQSGKLLTGWLPWSAGRAGETRKWDPVTIGEQVLILSPGGDLAAGIVVPSIYSDAFPAPSGNPGLHATHYPDGAIIEYDHIGHALNATLPDGSSATLTATQVIINAPETRCTGNLTVDQDITVLGGVNAAVDVTAAGVSLVNHVHNGVVPGSSNTGAPQ